MFLKLIRIWPPESDYGEIKEPYVINTDKIREVSEDVDGTILIELDGCDVVNVEATIDDFASIVGAKSLPGPWDDQK